MKAGGIDLVLADFMMLKLGGAKLIDQLKAISPRTPAIVFSGALGSVRRISSPTYCSPRPIVVRRNCWTISAMALGAQARTQAGGEQHPGRYTSHSGRDSRRWRI